VIIERFKYKFVIWNKMTLKDKIKKTVLDDLKEQDISNYFKYAAKNCGIFAGLYHDKTIDNASIEVVIEEAVIKKAKEDVVFLIEESKNSDLSEPCINKKSLFTLYQDHLLNPRYLAYALKKGAFSDEIINQISFDPEFTVESFVKKYARQNLVKKLANKFYSDVFDVATLF
jgi:hypothetical protein